jgi:hypothetical protein
VAGPLSPREDHCTSAFDSSSFRFTVKIFTVVSRTHFPFPNKFQDCSANNQNKGQDTIDPEE